MNAQPPSSATSTSISAQQLNDCATEPIQIPGSVQPHGILISLRATDFTILQISKNVYDLLGIEPNELLHQPLSQLMDIEPVRQAVKRLGERVPRILNPIPIHITVNGRTKTFDGILHRSGRVINLELEQHIGSMDGGFGGFYEAVRDTASKLFATSDVQQISEVACDEIRKLTGFDRVMMYKFDEDWNGTVIAESLGPGVEGYRNHRFPASDIPAQARALYVVNWLRLIPDINYVPSPIIPAINPLTDRPLDLSNAVLRSVSPVHVEYMRNMGLGASMSISILKGNQLWGLISCHHLTPHYLRYEIRVACEFIGQMLSGQIDVREQSAEFDHKLQLKSIYTHLLAEGGSNDNLTAALVKNSSAVLALTESHGAAICLNGGFALIGRTPTREQTTRLITWLNSTEKDRVVTSHLAKDFADAREYQGVASGLLALCVPKENGGWILWFRGEQHEKVSWGGNPEQAKVWSDSESRFRPRLSFETWTELVEGQSKKWLDPEIEVALEFRRAAAGLANRSQAEKSAPPAVQTQSTLWPREQTPIPTFADAAATIAREKTAAGNPNLNTAGHIELINGFTDLSLALLDTGGMFRSWSQGAAKMLGYSKSDVIGKPFAFLLPESEALKNRGTEILDRAALQKRVTEELWLYRKDGSSFWAKIGLNRTASLNSVEGSYSLIIEDYTEEKAAEEELKVTKVAAESANRTKSAFLANISHEIRTPLGAVLGFAELMNSPDQSDAARATLYERVVRNGQQLTALINDLLDMSKAEAGRLEVEMIDFDFTTLVSDIEQTFSLKAVEKNISLQFEVHHHVPTALRSDPTRIRQILINLLSNALKFTNDGGSVRVHIGIEDRDNRKLLCFRVSDSGRGMSEDEQSRLFQPFAQADVSMTRKFGGTGLGLFVSRRLARALGGDMKIEATELGKGTTFLATIDVTEPPTTLAAAAPRATGTSTSQKNTLSGMHLLLVDDSPDNRELISIFLKGAGAKVSTAENGAVGLERIAKEDFDLVLMDIQMPIMDGHQTMRELKLRGYKKPVLALTAHAMKEEREHSMALGFSGYLTKPINRTELISTIESFKS